ncbi:M23 family metallopeptidase [Sphingomonas panacisoli]|uniref:M23 family metallopeptidase n=1 Tax=Sphingomonas panacisoli TaxID=1813879 RepID=A0A5B8LJ32_9SPHN|nr:M23 family metallopeptidase [Sphingomonas panacisoli]QDZ07956.1 M23 family metallopeptidase [Sphingomonas panacisoli]
MINFTSLRGAVARFGQFFKTRDFIFHDGRDLRRFSIAGRTQAALAAAFAVTLFFSAYGVAQAGAGAIALTGLTEKPLSPEAKVASMEAAVADMQTKIQQIKYVADVRAKRVEARQAMLAAALNNQGNVQPIAYEPIDAKAAAVAADVVEPLARVERSQVNLAIKARVATEKRYIAAVARAKAIGIDPARFQPKPVAMGGPLIAADSAEAAADLAADAQFRALFQTWKKLDTLEDGLISIPSVQPVTDMKFTSNFGIRSDPFRGTAAFHPGVDIPCATGTAVYATADGVVDKAERSGGYGNMVEIDHGRGIQTRFGHLSKILVTAGQKVKRGQLIALSGSTGRSTGPHLHYEVRIDGRAVNPMPFLTTADYLTALKNPQLNAVPVSTEAASDSAD